MLLPHMLMAIAPGDSKSISSVFVWSGVLVALLLVAFGGYSYLKRWMNATDDSPKMGFTLADLKVMHRQGKMSDAEFELARAKMVAAAKRATGLMPEVLPRRAEKIRTDNSSSPPPTE